MKNKKLALELINRLNDLIKDDEVRAFISAFTYYRPVVSNTLSCHPTIQSVSNDDGEYAVGFLGLLNGIVGAQEGGKYDKWGYIVAKFDDSSGELLSFEFLDGNN